MAKRISEEQKEEIINDFINEKSIDQICDKFNFTRLTIIRNLKKNLGSEKYYELMKKPKIKKTDNNFDSYDNKTDINDTVELTNEVTFSDNSFLEIAPLDYKIDNLNQKDLTSIPIKDADLPQVVYMIVDKQIELEPKLLKEYIEWNFLSEKELNRKTIEIHFDLKTAKRYCSKEQKVIKIPNSNVLKVVAPILITKGITRIVSNEMLIAL